MCGRSTAHLLATALAVALACAAVAPSGARGLTPEDSPPVLSGGGAATFTEGDFYPVPIAPDLQLTDPDSEGLTGAVVRITENFEAGADVLAASPSTAIVAVYDAATGTLTLTGDASVSEYRSALRSVTFENTSDTPSPSTRVLGLRASDSGPSEETTATVAVVATNDNPTVTLLPAPSLVVAGVPTPVQPDAVVTDPDGDVLRGARVYASGGELLPAALDDGIDERLQDAGTLILTGVASLEAYQSALRAVRFRGIDAGDAHVVNIVDDGEFLPSFFAQRFIVVLPGYPQRSFAPAPFNEPPAPPAAADPPAAAPTPAFSLRAPTRLSRRSRGFAVTCAVTVVTLRDCRVDIVLVRGGDGLRVAIGHAEFSSAPARAAVRLKIGPRGRRLLQAAARGAQLRVVGRTETSAGVLRGETVLRLR